MAAVVNSRTSIYLDTKFWIKLRDASMGKPQEPSDLTLLANATAMVKNGTTIFPFATDMVLELMEVGADDKRSEAARLVDELSLGVTLRTEEERAAIEIEDFIRRKG